MLKVQAPTDGLIIQDRKTNAIKLPFKDGDLISGTLVGKNKGTLSINFDGQQMDILSEANIKENIGDTISFKVKSKGDSWQLIYQQKASATNLDQVKNYNTLQQTNQLLEKNQEDDGRLTINNFNDKMKEAMDNLLKTMSKETIQQMKQYGMSVRKLSITMLTKINKNFGDKESVSTKEVEDYIASQVSKYEKAYGDEENVKKGIQALSKEGLLVTDRNLSDMVSLLGRMSQAKDLNMEQAVSLVKTEKPLNLNNIYQASYNGAGGQQKEHGLPDETVKEFLNKQGIKNTQLNKKIADTLLSQEVPLTKENVGIVKDLMNIEEYVANNENAILKQAINTLKQGGKIDSMPLPFATTGTSQNNSVQLSPLSNDEVTKIVEKLPTIMPQQIEGAMAAGKELNLSNLLTLTEGQPQEAIIASSSNMDHQNIVKAKRQLLEIQLKMTLEVAQRFNKQGISLDTTNLSDLVNALRNEEKQMYQNHLEAMEAPVTDENVAKMTKVFDTLSLVNQYRDESLGPVTARKEPESIQGLGVSAREAYETNQTKVDRQYGDGFAKVRGQIGELLEDQGIEASETNKRAAEILIRNEMDVTEEELQKVILLDQKVTTVSNKLHPMMVADMLRQGLDPLTMSMDEMKNYINGFQQEYGDKSGDRIGEIMVELDQKGDLTEEERKAVIGVYRVLHMVEKNKGQAVGLLMKEDQEVSLENLLDAANFLRKGGLSRSTINVDVDENFGEVKSSQGKEDLIRYQIKEAQVDQFVEELQQDMNNQLKYHSLDENRIIDHLIDLSGEMPEELLQGLKSQGKTTNLEDMQLLKSMYENPFALGELIGELSLEASALADSDELENFNQTMEQLEEIAEETGEEALYTEEIQLNQSGQIIQRAQQLGKMAKLQKELGNIAGHYQVPLRLNDKITNLHIYQLKDTSSNQNQEIKIALGIKNDQGQIIKGTVVVQGQELKVSLESSNDNKGIILEEKIQTLFNKEDLDLQELQNSGLANSKTMKKIGTLFAKAVQGE